MEVSAQDLWGNNIARSPGTRQSRSQDRSDSSNRFIAGERTQSVTGNLFVQMAPK